MVSSVTRIQFPSFLSRCSPQGRGFAWGVGGGLLFSGRAFFFRCRKPFSEASSGHCPCFIHLELGLSAVGINPWSWTDTSVSCLLGAPNRIFLGGSEKCGSPQSLCQWSEEELFAVWINQKGLWQGVWVGPSSDLLFLECLLSATARLGNAYM